MPNLDSLKTSILADGKIDSSEVAQIKAAIYADGKIDSDEANFLFDLNDGCSGAQNDPSWDRLFIDAICSFLLDDEKSPGVVDAEEGAWLLKRIQGDGKLDRLEKKLLSTLVAKANSIPAELRSLADSNE